jgi:hypothetical protein
MQLMTVNLSLNMYWGIYADDPKIFPLDSIPGWSLVNPFLYKRIWQQFNDTADELSCKPTYIVGDCFHIISKGFVLVSHEKNRDVDYNVYLEWNDKLINLIGYFRYASKQFSLMPNFHSYGPRLINELPDALFPIKGDGCVTPLWPIETALTKADINVVSSSSLTQTPPVYDTMLLDAIEAIIRQDYRTSVLLSAMAIENLARMKLDIEAKKMPNAVGFQEIRNAPFKKILHELPLRLLSKSLFQDNQNLYDQALGVYRRRNAIIHGGAHHDKTDYSIVSLAREAIQCAIQIVEWFGELGGYVNPLDKKAGTIFCNRSHYSDEPA